MLGIASLQGGDPEVSRKAPDVILSQEPVLNEIRTERGGSRARVLSRKFVIEVKRSRTLSGGQTVLVLGRPQLRGHGAIARIREAIAFDQDLRTYDDLHFFDILQRN